MPFALPPPRIRPWTRRRVETVGRYGIFDVLASEVVLPGGQALPGPFYTLTCPSWCNVLAITLANEAVLVWQYRHGTEAMALETPGGVIDDGESPLEAARRELREETGYEVDRIEPLLTVRPNPAFQGNTHHAFLARGARPTAAPKLDPGEECEVVLVPVEELERLIDDGHIAHALCVAPIERFLRRGGLGAGR